MCSNRGEGLRLCSSSCCSLGPLWVFRGRATRTSLDHRRGSPSLDQAKGLNELEPAAEAAGVADATSPAGTSEVEKAIRTFEEGLVRDYNKGDSKAIAALFTEDAEVVDIDGNATRAVTSSSKASRTCSPRTQREDRPGDLHDPIRSVPTSPRSREGRS